MNQIQFINKVKALGIFDLQRIGNYFVEVRLKGTDFFFERTFRSEWKQKRVINGREAYAPVDVSIVLDSCNEETRAILIKNLDLFARNINR